MLVVGAAFDPVALESRSHHSTVNPKRSVDALIPRER
jgi:hypothetical protein